MYELESKINPWAGSSSADAVERLSNPVCQYLTVVFLYEKVLNVCWVQSEFNEVYEGLKS